MLDPDLVDFATGPLPKPPARLLEIGAGSGELAEHLRRVGYDVVAIDPASETPRVEPVALDELEAPDESFDAAVAVVSLHHVKPLTRSCERLAAMLRPGALLVIDEFDVGALDEVAAQWWLEQGPTHSHAGADPGELVADMRRHLHRLADILEALEPWFEPGRVVRGPYLYRWDLGPATRPREERAIARGEIPATGARVVVRLRPAR